jgi:hypothetical protein
MPMQTGILIPGCTRARTGRDVGNVAWGQIDYRL